MLQVSDLEFVPSRAYAAIHGCGAVVTAQGTEMKESMNMHTETCQWMEPTA